MNHQLPPLVALPNELSDEAVATLLEFLYQLTDAFESAYAGQLHRYYRRPDDERTDPLPERDPPF